MLHLQKKGKMGSSRKLDMAFPHNLQPKNSQRQRFALVWLCVVTAFSPPAWNQSFLPVLIARSGYLLHIFLLAAAFSHIKAKKGIPSHESFCLSISHKGGVKLFLNLGNFIYHMINNSTILSGSSLITNLNQVAGWSSFP